MDTPSPAPAVAPSPAVARALRQVLRPLVKLMLAQGLTLPTLIEWLKATLVDVAQREFQLEGKPVTDSRVSLLTGVHRKDVSRLRALLATETDTPPAAVSLGAQLVARWLGDAHWRDADGTPAPLPRLASVGGDRSFDALVASVNKDIRARVVLDEWLRLGVARVDEQDRVWLNTDAFVPTEGLDEKAYYFGLNVADHAAAAVSNLLGQQSPLLERSVHYGDLSAEAVSALHAQARKLASHTLTALNQSALAATAQPADPAQRRQRFTAGIYFYCEDVPPGRPAPNGQGSIDGDNSHIETPPVST